MAEDLLGFPSLCSFYQTQSVHKQTHRHCNHRKPKSLHLPQGNGKPTKSITTTTSYFCISITCCYTYFFFNIAVWWHHAWVHCSVIICQDKVTDMIKEKLPFNKKNYSISHFLFFSHTEFLPNNFLWGKEIVILMNYRYTCILLVFPI